MTFIEEKLKEFEEKLYPNAIFDGDDVVQKIYLQKKLDDYFEKLKSFLRQLLKQQAEEMMKAIRPKSVDCEPLDETMPTDCGLAADQSRNFALKELDENYKSYLEKL